MQQSRFKLAYFAFSNNNNKNQMQFLILLVSFLPTTILGGRTAEVGPVDFAKAAMSGQLSEILPILPHVTPETLQSGFVNGAIAGEGRVVEVILQQRGGEIQRRVLGERLVDAAILGHVTVVDAILTQEIDLDLLNRALRDATAAGQVDVVAALVRDGRPNPAFAHNLLLKDALGSSGGSRLVSLLRQDARVQAIEALEGAISLDTTAFLRLFEDPPQRGDLDYVTQLLQYPQVKKFLSSLQKALNLPPSLPLEGVSDWTSLKEYLMKLASDAINNHLSSPLSPEDPSRREFLWRFFGLIAKDGGSAQDRFNEMTVLKVKTLRPHLL